MSGICIGAAAMAVATSPLAVTGGDTNAIGSGSRIGPGSQTVTTTSPVTVSGGTPSGGVSPYTRLWEYVSGDVLTVNSPNAQNTTFSSTITVTAGQTVEKIGVYRCKCTDNVGTVAYGPNCTVSISLEDVG